MRRTAGAGLLAVVASIAFAACGGDEGPNEPTVSGVACADAFAAATFQTIDDLPTTCRDEEGVTRGFATASYDCDDGRVLWWNDVAWGYLGEPAAIHAAGVELVPPEQEREACGV